MKYLITIVASFLSMSFLSVASLSPEEVKSLPRHKIEERLPKEHPSTYLIYAARLMLEDKKDAVFWYYVGSIRFRLHLAADPNMKPGGDAALFSSLQSVVGTGINEFAGGDPKMWSAQIDRALKWDEEIANEVTSKTEFKKEWEEIREGLMETKKSMESNLNELKAQRKKNGLPTEEPREKVDPENHEQITTLILGSWRGTAPSGEKIAMTFNKEKNAVTINVDGDAGAGQYTIDSMTTPVNIDFDLGSNGKILTIIKFENPDKLTLGENLPNQPRPKAFDRTSVELVRVKTP